MEAAHSFETSELSQLLLQSAPQPLWVLACSTIVEYSQQEGFYRVPLPAARQTPQLGGPVIRTFQLPPPGIPTSETTRANPSSGRWNYGREIAENFAESGDFLLHAVNCDVGPTALLPLRRKARWGFFRPKNSTASAGFEPANLCTRGQYAYL